jgi:hypothetical protein
LRCCSAASPLSAQRPFVQRRRPCHNLTPQLAGLFTYRPDFSDAPTNLLNVTVSPYAQSVPETRPFFLDGTNIFTFSHNLGQYLIPFYSKTVGLVDGFTVPVDEGVKVLGHAGGRYPPTPCWSGSSGQTAPSTWCGITA